MRFTSLAFLFLIGSLFWFAGYPHDSYAGEYSHSANNRATPRNIIFILADDVGYGDLGYMGATKVNTPNIDRLASQGLRFLNAYSPSATCTPTRYAILTGEYPWRKKGTGILPGDAALIVDPSRTTLPSVLRNAGCRTGIVGKWHLGLDGGPGKIAWNEEIKPGPLEVGFDSAFFYSATNDRTPCVYIEDHKIFGLDSADPIQVRYDQQVGNDPTGRDHPELLKMKLSHGHDNTIVNGISRIGYMSGGKAARWKDEDMADVLTKRAVDFIEKNKDQRFYLYFATHDIHVPRAPNQRFVGTSGCGIRGDAIQELDWSVGEVMNALDRLGLANDTLFIFSSDNGPVVDDGYDDGSKENLNGHTPAGPLRGGKATLYEGGTREPFIVRWPERVKPGVSDAMISQIDLMASFAALTGQALPAEAAPDSLNELPALLGESKEGRDYVIEHANNSIAIRKGNWKYIPASPERKTNGKVADPELYDLSTDPGEKKNVATEHPDIVQDLDALLGKLKSGPSRMKK